MSLLDRPEAQELLKDAEGPAKSLVDRFYGPLARLGEPSLVS